MEESTPQQGTGRCRAHLEIRRPYRPLLSELGLDSFEKLMFDDVGTVIKKGYAREIRRIDCGGRLIYLKRRFKPQPFRKSLEMYLQGMRAHTVPYIEYLHVRSLARSGFSVMSVIAAGEERRFGFPRRGFILLDEVQGTPLDTLLSSAVDGPDRMRLLRTYGQLLARLHRQGYYAAVRFKDIITTDQQGGDLVLIDRETRYPYPRRRSKQRARRTLDDSFRRISRELPQFGRDQQHVVMEAYNRCLAGG